jgi:pSer/pThr/pTyr-binding forkhead associated (FHA) protein
MTMASHEDEDRPGAGKAAPPGPDPGSPGPDTVSLDAWESTPPGESAARHAADLAAEDQLVVERLPAGSALLVTGAEEGTRQRFLLDEDKVTAGRHPRSDIFLDHATVSRSHAEFIRQGGRYVVRDAGSLNGLYVNALRVDEAVLSSGDLIQIGRYRLTFHASPAEPAQPSD